MKYIKKLSVFLYVASLLFNSIAYAETNGAIRSTTIIASGTLNGPVLLANDFYGSSGNAIGDLDADGVNDIIIGAYGDDTGGNRKGSVHISYMNSNGTIKSTVKITGATANGPNLTAEDFYGFASSGIGDLDNDGIPDIAVGVRNDDTGGINRGAVYIHYMNRDASLKSTVKLTGSTTNGATLIDSDTYGYSVFGPGDLDADGIPDLLVGSIGDDTGGTGRGAVYIHYMNRDASLKSTVKLTGSTTNGATLIDSDNYGSAVGAVGDLDNDGLTDIVVGAFGDDTGGTGRGSFYIHFMNVGGTVKSTVKISSGTINGSTLVDSDFYGVSVSGLGDIDGDSIPDMGVGSFFDDSSGANLGAFYIHYMNRDGSLKSTVRINSATANGATDLTAGPSGARYGNTVFSLGDLNNDGAIDIGVGATTDSITVPAGNQHGRVFLHFMQPVTSNRLTKTSLSVTEGGAIDSFSVSLKSKPTSSVTISLSGSQVSMGPSSLTFSTVNWATPQVVSVSGIDDNVVEQTHFDSVVLTDTSADPDYNNLTSNLSVSITDNDSRTTPIIFVTPTVAPNQNNDVLGFTINNSSSYTTQKIVTLNMNANPSTVRGYIVSNDPLFKDVLSIKPYVQNDSFVLSPVPGAQTVYLKYYSTTGQFSSVFSQTITYNPLGQISQTYTTKVFRIGDWNSEIKSLQIFLNKHGFILALSGAGSPGKETSYFGPLTQKSLLKFQLYKGIPRTGMLDMMTKMYITN